MLCFRNHHCTVSISLEYTNEASEVWSGILEVILLVLMKVHAYVCMYGLLHYWKKPSVMKKPSTSSRKYSNLWWSGCKCMYIPQTCTPWHSKCRVSSKLTGLSQSCLYVYFIWGLRVHLHISVDRRSNRVGTESHHMRQGGSSPKEGWKGEGNISAE